MAKKQILKLLPWDVVQIRLANDLGYAYGYYVSKYYRNLPVLESYLYVWKFYSKEKVSFEKLGLDSYSPLLLQPLCFFIYDNADGDYEVIGSMTELQPEKKLRLFIAEDYSEVPRGFSPGSQFFKGHGFRYDDFNRPNLSTLECVQHLVDTVHIVDLKAKYIITLSVLKLLGRFNEAGSYYDLSRNTDVTSYIKYIDPVAYWQLPEHMQGRAIRRPGDPPPAPPIYLDVEDVRQELEQLRAQLKQKPVKKPVTMTIEIETGGVEEELLQAVTDTIQVIMAKLGYPEVYDIARSPTTLFISYDIPPPAKQRPTREINAFLKHMGLSMTHVSYSDK